MSTPVNRQFIQYEIATGRIVGIGSCPAEAVALQVYDGVAVLSPYPPIEVALAGYRVVNGAVVPDQS